MQQFVSVCLGFLRCVCAPIIRVSHCSASLGDPGNTRVLKEAYEFSPVRRTADQPFTLTGSLEGSWEFASPVYVCFVILEKAYDCVSHKFLWAMLWENGVKRLLFWILIQLEWVLCLYSQQKIRHVLSWCCLQPSIYVPGFIYGHEFCVFTKITDDNTKQQWDWEYKQEISEYSCCFLCRMESFEMVRHLIRIPPPHTEGIPVTTNWEEPGADPEHAGGMGSDRGTSGDPPGGAEKRGWGEGCFIYLADSVSIMIQPWISGLWWMDGWTIWIKKIVEKEKPLFPCFWSLRLFSDVSLTIKVIQFPYYKNDYRLQGSVRKHFQTKIATRIVSTAAWTSAVTDHIISTKHWDKQKQRQQKCRVSRKSLPIGAVTPVITLWICNSFIISVNNLWGETRAVMLRKTQSSFWCLCSPQDEALPPGGCTTASWDRAPAMQ